MVFFLPLTVLLYQIRLKSGLSKWEHPTPRQEGSPPGPLALITFQPDLILHERRDVPLLRRFPGQQIVHADGQEAAKVGEEPINRRIINALVALGVQCDQDTLRD